MHIELTARNCTTRKMMAKRTRQSPQKASPTIAPANKQQKQNKKVSRGALAKQLPRATKVAKNQEVSGAKRARGR